MSFRIGVRKERKSREKQWDWNIWKILPLVAWEEQLKESKFWKTDREASTVWVYEDILKSHKTFWKFFLKKKKEKKECYKVFVISMVDRTMNIQTLAKLFNCKHWFTWAFWFIALGSHKVPNPEVILKVRQTSVKNDKCIADRDGLNDLWRSFSALLTTLTQAWQL